MSFGDATLSEVRQAVYEARDKTDIVAAHYGKGWNRRIEYHEKSDSYRVFDHDKLVLSTIWLDKAVDAYNDIRADHT